MKTKIAAVLTAAALAFGATACTPSEYQQRKDNQKTSQIANSLEKQNLEKKRDKEEDPNAIRYVYILSYANIIGFYTAKGKISSSASQVGPETEVISGYILDSAKDDGTYAPGDPGIFFFTTDGVMVETSLDYIVSDQPLPIDVPRFSK
ncbi:hypothetical protein SEA_BAUER_67 [Arthrobacter phage Bauer]|uniref:Lipoprotein n=1 Tax=Arthrobacter phage Bauer TaxID=2985648 RepID=A0A9E8AAE9_9CAUD|nr:hypothetical protein QEO99_gp67 [Arthrobacter phage Bauer]UYM26616.1 hypothetical protein SEA_BAUER_67 [Arthrobacter phage Bauer]